MEKLLTFDDVTLVPKYSEIRSRSLCDTRQSIFNTTLSLPIIPSNMKTVTGYSMVKEMDRLGTIGVLHRFSGWEDVLKEIANDNSISKFAVSIGVNNVEQQLELIISMPMHPAFIVIDVAHGHHVLVKEAIKKCKQLAPNIPVIAGNIVTREAADDLVEWGANGVKVGIGNGCFTAGMQCITSRGILDICDVQKNDFVYSYTGELERVVETISRDCTENEIMLINDIECTENHEFYVIDRVYCDTVTEANIHEYAYWIRAADITQEHMLINLDHGQ